MAVSRTFLLLLASALAVVGLAAIGFKLFRAHIPHGWPLAQVKWVNNWSRLPSGAEHFAFDSRAMGRKVGVTVQRPAHDNPAPVIYFLHGRGGNEVSDLHAFMAMLRPILQEHHLPEPVVVFPNGGLTGYYGPMASMIVDELIPYIESRYRTRTEPQFRLLAGFSMGGAGSVRLALDNPTLFGGAASWGGGMRDPVLLERVAKNAAEYRERNFQFLLVNGEMDRPRAFVALADVLQQHEVPHERVELTGVHHDMGLYFDRSKTLYARHLLALWK